MTTLTLLIPTIQGREKSLERTLLSYANQTGRVFTQRIVKGFPSIGAAWAEHLPKIQTDLAHLGTDDVTAESRWANEIRFEWEEHRGLAVPLMLRMPDATLESHGGWGAMHTHRTEVPWCGVPVIPACCYSECATALERTGLPQNYSDNVLCDVLRSHGHMLVARPRYRLGHWWAAGGLGSTRDETDRRAWLEWRDGLGMPPHEAPLSVWEAWGFRSDHA